MSAVVDTQALHRVNGPQLKDSGVTERVPALPVNPPALNPEQVLRLAGPGARARQNKNLLIYLHVPFCSSKCHFCDWVVGYSTADLVNTGELRTRYVDALCREIEAYGPMLKELGYTATNIYWGGGTPTRLAPAQMSQIFETLDRHLDLSHVVEHTAECSPETVTVEHLNVLRQCGLNRISAGAQSFDKQILRRMGRAHSADQVEIAVERFKQAGLTNFNLDLIAGFPGQSTENLLDSIRKAVDAKVPHLSVYMFREFAENLVTVKQVTRGHAEQDPRTQRASAYWEAKRELEAAGYEEYVVGYFAKAPEFRFNAEEYYFGIRGDYFGFGAGAASVLGRCVFKSGETSRYGNSNVRTFIDDPLSLTGGPLARMPDELFTDAYFKAFAMQEGIRFDRWNDQFGFDFRSFRNRRPGINKWFQEQEESGAVFVEDDHGIALSPETWVNTMLWRR